MSENGEYETEYIMEQLEQLKKDRDRTNQAIAVWEKKLRPYISFTEIKEIEIKGKKVKRVHLIVNLLHESKTIAISKAIDLTFKRFHVWISKNSPIIHYKSNDSTAENCNLLGECYSYCDKFESEFSVVKRLDYKQFISDEFKDLKKRINKFETKRKPIAKSNPDKWTRENLNHYPFHYGDDKTYDRI